MKYTFKDIYDESSGLFRDSRVLFITGRYNVFNNLVHDKMKNMYSMQVELDETGLLEEFGIDTSSAVVVSNTVDFENFMQVCFMPSVNGDWFCSTDLSTLTKKQQDWLKEYIKKPSKYAILVLMSTEFKHYRFWLNSTVINNSPEVSIIQLSFPNKEALNQIAMEKFIQRGTLIDERALELFVVRMSSEYDDYDKIIDKICIDNIPMNWDSSVDGMYTITYEDVTSSMKGIEYFVIDDFLQKLTEPLSNDKVSGKKTVYRIMGYMIALYGERRLVAILRSRIEELIEFRLMINKGYIPILVNYNVSESKELIGEESVISDKSDYQFKKLAKLASQTSLMDWTYMWMLLKNVNRFDDSSYNKALYSLVSRSVLTESRIENDVGRSNILKEQLNWLDNIPYIDQSEILKGEYT